MAPFTQRLVEFVGNRVLAPFGYEVREKILNEKPEGFPGYLAEAQKAGLDVNVWEEQALGWYPAQKILEATTFPRLRDDSVVVEVGPGTGRFSRLILPRIPSGTLHLVDHSPWMVRFLQEYFRAEGRVQVHLGDGQSLPLPNAESADMVFAAGTLVALKLGQVHLYARDFARVLKPGGLSIFDYIDPTTPAGWEHMQREAERLGYVYTYHAEPVIDRVLAEAGFAKIERQQIEKSTYVIATRGVAPSDQ